MSQAPTTTPTAPTVNMRAEMPETARWIDRMRAQMGRAHVNACIRRSLAGEPGLFYAIEQGHTLGTPFPAGSPMDAWQQCAVVTASPFAGFLAQPPKGTDGTH